MEPSRRNLSGAIILLLVVAMAGAAQERALKRASTMTVASVEDSCLLVAGATRYANRHRR
ncbi:hypothetical protein HU200_053659 [Digitaria exilis]|uniref:Uncharacterized protein n=1 Tax=Digitaria exilis TaxID=1010633 RepID=A0A835AK74_9POAL|nr:hypothetical protein HU200_053659 [Digitaria exilis]